MWWNPRSAIAGLMVAGGLLSRRQTGPIFTFGDFDNCIASGIIIESNSTEPWTGFYFYNENSPGDFDTVYKYVWIQVGDSVFVSLPEPFQAYIQRGTDELNLHGALNLPATMVEFQLDAADSTGAHGDISLEQGCDGAATIFSTTTSVCGGFTQDILNGAPAAAFAKKPDGSTAIDTTMGDWASAANPATIAWEQSQISETEAYILGGTGTYDIASSNNRFEVTFY